MARRWRPFVVAGAPVVIVAGVTLGCIGTCVGFPCVPTGVRYGMWLAECPATDLRLDVDVSAYGLLRGQPGGVVRIAPVARWLDGDDRDAGLGTHPLGRGFSWTVVLKDDRGAEVPGLVLEQARSGDAVEIPVQLPEIPDGDYVLHVTVDAGFESATIEVPVPVYAPAIVHLMTDRPLYKPGQDVLLRSVALRRTDLHPLDGRPGRWRIVDPEGTEMLVERDRASTWGIADGSFPLDSNARVGTWTAAWVTGDASDQVTFEVRPFRLPRFSVEAAADRSWHTVGQELVIEGHAKYGSGAPIGGVPVEVVLQAESGRWPIPLEWESPHTTRTTPDGRFRLSYGAVPPDLMDRSTFVAQVSVTDETGETGRAGAPIVLSRESLKVEIVTELAGGLVQGFNNRAYLRVATPDGRPLADADLVVRRPYDPDDPGKQTRTDVDGVAALQIDPGSPVTVVEPAPPVRVRPRVSRPPQLVGAVEKGEERGLDLEERRAFDLLLPSLASCGLYASGTPTVSVGIQVDRAGRVRRTSTDGDPLSACVAGAATAAVLPAGAERTYSLQWNVPDAMLPSIAWTGTTAFGSAPVLEAWSNGAIAARRCLQGGTGIDGARVLVAHWSVEKGSRAVQTVIDEEAGHGLAPATVQCVRAALGTPTLEEPAGQTAMGVASAALSVPVPPGSVAPQASTRSAYELAVTASSGDETLGEGRLVVEAGAIPSLRMRAEPSLVRPGDSVTVELLRGPGFSGELPEKLRLTNGSALVEEATVVEKAAKFTIPEGVNGFLQVEWGGARSVVFVAPSEPLSVALSTDRSTYRPGETATLTVETLAGTGPVAAAVSLVGVDTALGQLAPLVGANDFGRVTVRTSASRPAFGIFEPKALVLGQIRGENAAKAAVLAIDGLPADPAGDSPANGTGQRLADTQERLTADFYRALDRASGRIRAWEAGAGEGELFAPERMVEVWDGALADLAAEGAPAVDGYGRPLALEVLPLDLLALTDPRTLVADASRLPEDFVGWVQYVDQEVRR